MLEPIKLILRDHAIFILIISSMISIISGVFLTRFNAKKDKESQISYEKQEFHINFVVHQIQTLAHYHKQEFNIEQNMRDKTEKLYAEFLIKGDLRLINELITLQELSKSESSTSNSNKILLHAVSVINRLRKLSKNEPITVGDYRKFMALSFDIPEYLQQEESQPTSKTRFKNPLNILRPNSNYKK